MKVLLLSWSDLSGGAALAAYRLHHALRDAGVQSRMLVSNRAGNDRDVLGAGALLDRLVARGAARLDRMPLGAYRERRSALFSPALAPDRTLARVHREARDLTHLHWLGNGALRVESLGRLPGPVVWTMHDLWAFTGGCHYPQGCSAFRSQCGRCPQLGSAEPEDLSRRVWKRKRESWQRVDLTIVAPSHWMARQAAASSLLSDRRIEVIPNCLDTDVFRAGDQEACRQALGLPRGKRILMFGALTAEGDRRKGFHLVVPALEHLAQAVPVDSLHLAIIGMARPSVPPDYPIATSFLGVLDSEQEMVQAYGAADVFVAPSLEDNLPNTVMEALACGVPCVGFDVGGMPDLIEHEVDGYLAETPEPPGLARGIAWVLEDPERHTRLRAQARAGVLERFAPKVVARRHLALYQELVAGAASRGSHPYSSSALRR